MAYQIGDKLLVELTSLGTQVVTVIDHRPLRAHDMFLKNDTILMVKNIEDLAEFEGISFFIVQLEKPQGVN